MINHTHFVHVSIGEVKVGSGEDILMTSLGSCVGIAFFWQRKNLYGLAHCLLPEAPDNAAIISARFVSQAIPSLISLMDIDPRQRREISAVITGGGNMTAPRNSDPKNLIGTLNTEAAERYVKGAGIEIVHKDIGGEYGRKLYLYCNTGEYSIKPIPRILKDVI
jgi:chemotaxis protein CheD